MRKTKVKKKELTPLEIIDKLKEKIINDYKKAEEKYVDFINDYVNKNKELFKKIDEKHKDTFTVKNNFRIDFNEDLKKETKKKNPDEGKINKLSEDLNKTLKDLDRLFNKFFKKSFDDAIAKDDSDQGKKFKNIKKKYDEAKSKKNKFKEKLKKVKSELDKF